MPEIEIIRTDPPALARCHHATCRAAIEWVRSLKRDRVMPVDHPVTPIRVHARLDGTLVTVIDAGATHFATCPAASLFRRKGRP